MYKNETDLNNYDKLISFTILRIHVGGYHAKSEHQCKVQSAIVTVLALVLIKEISFMAWYGYWVMVMISIFNMVNDPVEAKNKPLSVKEKCVNHKKSCFIIVLLNILTGIFALGFYCYPTNCINYESVYKK